MTKQMPDDILEALPVRRGHFLLESGYHTDLWFTLDTLFVDPKAIALHVAALAELLRPFSISAVCGPLQGGAFLAYAIAIHMGLRFYFTQQELPQTRDIGNAEAGLFTAEYRLPVDLRRRVVNERIAIVDDVISAGSSVRATEKELNAAGARTVVVGTILLLGKRAVEYFSSRELPLVALAAQDFNLWAPEECPSCTAGELLEDPRDG